MNQNELVRAALVVVAALLGLQLLWSARFLVLTAFLGVLFGLATASAVDWIRTKVPIRRSIAAPLVVFGAVGMLVLIGFWSGPTLGEQSRELRTKLPEAVGKVENWLETKQPGLLNLIAPPDTAAAAPDTAGTSARRAAGVQGASESEPTGGRLFGAFKRHVAKLGNLAFGVVQSTFAVIAGLVLVIFLAVYIAMDPLVYKRGLLLLLPAHRRAKFDNLLVQLARTLRTWFATQLIAMLVIGIITTVALLIIGVPAAIPLGVLAGIFEFIPNVGPILSAIPAVLMGFVSSPQMALTVVILYWAIQFLENNLLIPYLMREQLDLPPALTLVTQVVMAYVFGFLGLFVAIPLLATIVVTVRVLWIGEDEYARSGSEPEAPAKAGEPTASGAPA
ncbi:MAG: AI-2E family transporter [Gemmatimonadaceae bacterium]